MVLKWILKKEGGRLCAELNWLGLETNGGPLWKRRQTFGFHEGQGVSWPFERIFDPQEGLCSMKLVILLDLRTLLSYNQQR